MSEYNRLKSMLLDMQPKLLSAGGGRSQQRDMEEKRALVDTMFKYLDADQDGWLVSDELEKVGVENSGVVSRAAESRFERSGCRRWLRSLRCLMMTKHNRLRKALQLWCVKEPSEPGEN